MELTRLFLADLDAEARRSRKALEQVPEGHYDWKPHEKSMHFGYLETPRHEVIGETLRHLAHHRGQMTVYLRLLGATVPARFGPSADENTF
jgi:uncharacterized damage-inducible protein DinB